MAELGSLGMAVRAAVGKAGGDANAWIGAYAAKDGWFRLDQAQRRLEAWVANLDDEPEEHPLGVVLRQQVREGCFVGLARARSGEVPIGVGNAVGDAAADAELVEVIVLPAHDDLEHPVQSVEADVERHLDAPTYGRFDLSECDRETGNLSGIAHAARLAEARERPKLPKMLRRKDLLDTVANGCEQGLFVLSLQRPDGSARTWWRTQADEAAFTDDALEAVQNSAAVLDTLDPSLLGPGKLDELDWKSGVKVADLVSYFDGYVLTIDHPDEAWTEQKAIPRCPEAKVLEAVGAAVKAGAMWLTSGTASVWGDTPPAGIVSKTAVLRLPPQPIDVSSLTPEALPDAWSGNKTTAHSIEQAVAAQRGVASLPWKLVESAITGALNSGFLRLMPGPVPWPCQPHEAAVVEFGLPEVTMTGDRSGGGKASGINEPPADWPKPKAVFRAAVLDSSQMTELVEAMGDVLAAAGNLTLRFRVAVEFADGEVATPEIAAKLASALDKATAGFG